jgi:hypothetical protein
VPLQNPMRLRSRSRASRRSASPELAIIIRHGKAVLGVLSLEEVIGGLLRLLHILNLIGPKLKEIIEPIFLWTAAFVVIIFCITAVAIAALNAFEEIRRRYKEGYRL